MNSEYANPAHKRKAQQILESFNRSTSIPAKRYIIHYDRGYYTVTLVIGNHQINHSSYPI